MTVIISSLFILLWILPLHSSYLQNPQELGSKVDDVFRNLMKKYEKEALLTDTTRASIDDNIKEYLKRILGQVSRNGQQHSISDGYEVINNFEETLRLNVSDATDIHFFKIHRLVEEWFAIVLTCSRFEIHRFKDGNFRFETSYLLPNASRLNTLEHDGSTLIFIWSSFYVNIFTFHQQDEKFIAEVLQSIEVHDITYVSTWRFSGKSYFGVASTSGVWIYSWAEDSFRVIQRLPYGAQFLDEFHTTESTFLICAQERRTSILEYSKESPYFSTSQIIRRSSPYITNWKIGNNTSEEHFLSLSSHKNTILYKKSVSNVFVPFQELGPSDQMIPIVKNESVYLISLKDRKLEMYRYDGWRFVELNFQVDGIKTSRFAMFRGDEQILVKNFDGIWSLKRIIWTRSKIPGSSHGMMKRWCSIAKNRAKQIGILLKKTHSSIKNLEEVHRNLEVSRANADDLEDLVRRYDRIVSRMRALNESIHNPRVLKVLHLSGLQSNSLNLKCTGKCVVKRLVTKLKCDILSHLKKPNDETQTVRLERVKVDKLDGFLCPVPGLRIDEMNVQGLVNGQSFEELVKNALRRSGDQIITGEHVLANLRTSSVHSPSVELASNYTRQRIRIQDSVRANELKLVDGGLLLPLDGEPVTMSGQLKVARAKFDGLVQLRCRPRGQAVSRIAPSIDFLERYELVGNYTLENVRVVSELRARDVQGSESGKTLSRIGEAAVPLDAARVPVRLLLQQNRTIWSNITVEDFPTVLTKKNSRMVQVTGVKVAVNDVTLSNLTYSKLPLPNLDAKVCSMKAVMPDIRTSTLSVDYAKANVVVGENVHGAKELDDSISDSVTSLNDVDLSRKSFSGSVFVENMNLKNIEESPFYCFQKAKFVWYNPDTIQNSSKLKNLRVGSLNVTKGMKIPAPEKIRNMIINGNLQIKEMNGINLENFVRDTVHIDDDVYLHSVEFDNLEAEEVETLKVNVDLQNFQRNSNLGKKTILGDLIIENDLTVQNLLTHPLSDEVNTYVIHGSITFLEEPNVEYINGEELSKLISDTWISNCSSFMTGDFVFKNLTLKESFKAFELLNTPNLGMWKDLESRTLSRTKSQLIEVPAHIQSVTVPNAVTEGNSCLQSADLYLNELFFTTLKKNMDVTINDKWHFEELHIQDALQVHGKVNNLNLSSDIARHDVGFNVVTGKKVVEQLTARNLGGLNFGEWVKDTLTINDDGQASIVRGKKIFHTFGARSLNVSGTVVGKDLQKCLLKIGDQEVRASKNIEGSIQAPHLTVKGFVNGLNFTDFANNRLKKHGPKQVFKSQVVFESPVQILGNLTAAGNIHGIEFEREKDTNKSFTPVVDALTRVESFAKGIDVIMERRAKYWSKFEAVNEDAVSPLSGAIGTSDSSEINNSFGRCSLVNPLKLVCSNKKEFFLKYSMDSAEVLLNKTIFVRESPILVQIGSGLRSKIIIHTYDPAKESFDVALIVRASGMTKAAVSSLDEVIWIAARLRSEMLLIRFQPKSGEARKYHLSESQLLALEKVPVTDELVLIRDDGFWKLEGLAGPRLAFEVGLDAQDVETFATEQDFFVGLLNSEGKRTKLLRTRFVGL